MMTDYTPTNEEVKNWYVVGKNEFEAAPYSYSEQEFDRWLAQHDAEVWARAKREFLDEQLGNVRMRVEAERAEIIRRGNE